MAFRKHLLDTHGRECLRENFDFDGSEAAEIVVVTQKGAYHGDTLACMNGEQGNRVCDWDLGGKLC